MKKYSNLSSDILEQSFYLPLKNLSLISDLTIANKA
jgi:hypothetical protein